MDNIFKSLAKYPSGPEHTPEENYFTEAFAYILNSNPKLLNELIKTITNFNNIPRDLEVSTQFVSKYPSQDKTRNIPDMLVKSKRSEFKLFIENKVGAALTEGQVRDYLSVLKKERAKVLVCLTASDEKPIRNKKVMYFRWIDVLKVLNKHQSEEINLKVKTFCEFMDSKGLSEDLTIEDFSAFDGTEENEYRRELAKLKFYNIAKNVLKKLPKKIKSKLTFYEGNKWGTGCWCAFVDSNKKSPEGIPHYALGINATQVWVDVRLQQGKIVHSFLNKIKDNYSELKSVVQKIKRFGYIENYSITLNERYSKSRRIRHADVYRESISINLTNLDKKAIEFFVHSLNGKFQRPLPRPYKTSQFPVTVGTKINVGGENDILLNSNELKDEIKNTICGLWPVYEYCK